MSENTLPPVSIGKNRVSIYILNISLVILLIAAIVWGFSTYLNVDEDVYTNDAQIAEYINPVNARIPGYIKYVRFEEHQQVKKGDTLVLIDNSEYKIALEQSEAAYLSAEASKNVTLSNVLAIGSGVSVSKSNVIAAEARLYNARQNFQRYAALLKDGAATQQQFDQVKSDFDALAAQVAALKEQRRTAGLSTAEAGKKVTVNDAEIKRAHAVVDLAKLNLSYTVIRAPYNGVTGRRYIQEGQLIQAGQNLLSFVRNDNKWVVANYRETQLGKIQVGQKVVLKIDALNDAEIPGKIDAISEATGSQYSAVPIDNSTGNFVKVQQRVPVKIVLSANSDNDKKIIAQLRAGMNVEVRIAH